MKKIIALLVVMALLLLLPACGSEENKVKDFDPADLSAALLDSNCFTDLLSEMDTAVALELYGIDAEKVDGCSVYLGTGATAEEIAVFKAVDADAAAEIAAALQDRVASQVEAYKNYVPKEVPKLEKAIVLSKGVYAVYVTAEDSDGARSIVDNFMKS
ncbi:MAG: DUF4358 domain-containing protein [Oscillospiraceae bacterium]